MDSMVALYWILNPGNSWKVFVANRVRKIVQISEELLIEWKYCPSEMNLADMGSRGVFLSKMKAGGWYTRPQWLLTKDNWPEQPSFKSTARMKEEDKPLKENILYTADVEPDEWDHLLEHKPYWNTLRVTAWVLQFACNS